MTLESPEQKAKRVINEHLDPDFETKFEKVKPFLDEYEKKGFDLSKQNNHQEQDSKDIENIKAALAEINNKEPSKPNIIALETNMFSKEKINERAQNRISLIEKGKLNTPEKRAQNRIFFGNQIDTREKKRQERKNIAQQLVAWWKSIDTK